MLPHFLPTCSHECRLSGITALLRRPWKFLHSTRIVCVVPWKLIRGNCGTLRRPRLPWPRLEAVKRLHTRTRKSESPFWEIGKGGMRKGGKGKSSLFVFVCCVFMFTCPIPPFLIPPFPICRKSESPLENSSRNPLENASEDPLNNSSEIHWTGYALWRMSLKSEERGENVTEPSGSCEGVISVLPLLSSLTFADCCRLTFADCCWLLQVGR